MKTAVFRFPVFHRSMLRYMEQWNNKHLERGTVEHGVEQGKMDKSTKDLLKKKLSTLNRVPKRTPKMEHAVEHAENACSKRVEKQGPKMACLEQGLEQGKCQNGTQPELPKWPATPRYLLSELERAGHRREDVRHIVWAAWIRSTTPDVDCGGAA